MKASGDTKTMFASASGIPLKRSLLLVCSALALAGCETVSIS
jgi:hypothetical protein